MPDNQLSKEDMAKYSSVAEIEAADEAEEATEVAKHGSHSGSVWWICPFCSYLVLGRSDSMRNHALKVRNQKEKDGSVRAVQPCANYDNAAAFFTGKNIEFPKREFYEIEKVPTDTVTVTSKQVANRKSKFLNDVERIAKAQKISLDDPGIQEIYKYFTRVKKTRRRAAK